jgi:CHRD domain-containing protein
MRFRPFVFSLVLVALFASVAGVVLGNERSRVKATLSGYEETPSTISTPASGSFVATIDEAADPPTITYTLTISPLTGAVLFAHVHFGARGTSGGVAAFLCGGGTKPAPCPQTGGTVTGTITPADVVGPTTQGIAPGEWAELVAAIRAGVAYANVHSTTWTGGEIRGQINDDNQK